MLWKSKRKYLTERGVGFIAQMGAGYIVETPTGRWPMKKELAENVKRVESKEPGRGRPALFAEEEILMRGVTLPTKYWSALGKDASTKIAELIEKAGIV